MNWIDRVPLEAVDPRRSDDVKLEAGAVLKFEDGCRLLVGHVNALGGECDDCISEYLTGRGPRVVAVGHVQNLKRKETRDGT